LKRKVGAVSDKEAGSNESANGSGLAVTLAVLLAVFPCAVVHGTGSGCREGAGRLRIPARRRADVRGRVGIGSGAGKTASLRGRRRRASGPMMPKKAGTARKLVFRFQIMELNSCKAGMVCCVMANRGRKLGAARKVPCNTLIFQRDLGVPKPRCFAGALLKRIKIGYQILGGPRAKPRCFAGALLKRDGLGGVGDLVAEAKPRCFAGALLKRCRSGRLPGRCL
jgi:hypothetical protein